MTSARLVLAAQTNGKKSQGPKTPEGKRRPSANSRKHGLYSKTLHTDAACEAEYHHLALSHFSPVAYPKPLGKPRSRLSKCGLTRARLFQ